MLKPYSTRNEFLLTSIAGSICALVHYMFTWPPNIEESVHVFAVIALVVFTLTYGGLTLLSLGARDNPDRIKVSVSWRDVVLPWGLIVLMIAVIVITGSRELATIVVALGILFSPVLPYDNDTDGADKRHQKWGIGLCALGVIYYFTLYPQLIGQVTLT